MKLGALQLLIVLAAACGSLAMDMCVSYPSTDPCLPGGTWDPIVNSCMGYMGMTCYQCHSGALCKEMQDTKSCELNVGNGNPLFIAEYWRNKSHHDPCTGVLGHYRPGYQFPHAGYEFLLPPLEKAIRTLHEVTANAETDGYEIVPGMGATMVLHTVIVGLSEKILAECTSNCPAVVDVLVQAPFYPGYEDIVSLVKTARWNSTADPHSPFTIEILTYPNNPTGERRVPLVSDPRHVIRDMVYYWPSYTNTDVKFAEPIMVFSSSKHDGLAGTRFGWGLIKDAELVKRVTTTVEKMVLSFSVDIQLRVLSSLQTVLSVFMHENAAGEPRTASGLLPFHAYTRDVMFSRFQRLRSALTCAELTNAPSSPGAYAWIHCSSSSSSNGSTDCGEFFAKEKVVGHSGVGYGATAQYVRFSLILPSIEFDILIEKVKLLCSQ